MDKTEINRRMATEVMDWVEGEKCYYWNGSDGLPNALNISKYNPADDLNQAMMGVEKLIPGTQTEYYFHIGRNGLAYVADIFTRSTSIVVPDQCIGSAYNDNLATAICLALLEAVENMKKEN